MAASSLGRRGAVAGLGLGPIAAIVVAILALAVAGGTYLYDHSRRDVIANGITIDGVAVGGMRESAARRKLERSLIARLTQHVTVRSGSHAWTLDARQAHVSVDLSSMLGQAVSVSREGSIVTRTVRGLFGGSVKRDIPLLVSYSHQAVRNLTAEVRAEVNRAPHDATVQPSVTGLTSVPGQVGLTVDSASLGARIDRALIGATASRTVTVPAHHVEPKVTTAQLTARFAAFIVIDRASFRLRFYDHLKLAKTYEIAVGMEGLETPAGMYHIQWEQVNPPWYVPKKAWAGALAGTVVPPGPADPLKARFMSFSGGAGIHGIDPSEYSSIGHDASHGCVRMRIPDVIDLYAHSPVGTPVYII